MYEFTRKKELSAINVRILRLADLQEAPPDRRLPNLETAKVSVKLQRKMAQGLNRFNKTLEKEIRWQIDTLNELAERLSAA